MKMLLLTLLLSSLVSQAMSAFCDIIPPLETSTGSDVGFFMLPGAAIPGEDYAALGIEIQKQLPGARVWIGLTEGWLGNFPNPIEISGALDNCVKKAADMSLGSEAVFMSGHSLGGIMLGNWMADHGDRADGIVLLGSYLPDLFGDHDNSFSVPVLTAVGTVDGMTLSYVYREWLESAEAEEEAGVMGMYPVILIDGANHAQVASGDTVPNAVLEKDIPSSISFEEAHTRYAAAIASFITIQRPDIFSEDETLEADFVMESLKNYTNEFLQPFMMASLMETDPDTNPQTSHNFMIEGQKVLLGASSEELMLLFVENNVVEFGDLGETKPSSESDEFCVTKVTTYSTPQYDLDPVDADGYKSASVIKAKFKLEDVVREDMCLGPQERKECMDINSAAFDIALELATEEARERYYSLGSMLYFDHDSVSPWGPGWEFSTGLHINRVNGTHYRLYSTSLISEPDFFIPSAAGMHYCDILSPYRALEWIYLISLQGKGMEL